MSSIFNTLNIGYTGLSAAQVGINVTSNNITNAETEGYTRQRVVQASQTPLFSASGNVGNGVRISDITRIFDNYVYDRYTDISAEKEYTEFSEQTLTELSTFFPDIDGVGLKADLSEYFNMWQSFADNPDNDAIKVALTAQTETLSTHINQTQEHVKSLQDDLNSQLVTNINEVNGLAKQLADINVQIDTAEAGDVYVASDLRDRRNLLEKDLARLIGSDVNQGQLESNIQIDSRSNTKTGSYTLSVNGFNIVDGNTFHPLHVSNTDNRLGFYEVSYERQDGTLIPMEETLNGGKIGSILDLRGGTIDTTTGAPRDGTIQNVLTQLDALANGLIENTNNLYARSSAKNMNSNPLSLDKNTPLISSGMNVHEGSFELVVYDVDGEEVSRKSIDINVATSLGGAVGSNSIEGQIKNNDDDNEDGNASNDIDDYITYNYQESADGVLRLEFGMDPQAESKGYTFSLEDKLSSSEYSSGTNFAGALGLGRYFDGDNASNIRLTENLKNNPTSVNAGSSGTSGDNSVALSMVQQQFESYEFDIGSDKYDTTIYGMYDITATYVGISTNTAIGRNETTTTQYNAIELEYNSVSKVSIDEELTNLIKYQTSYGAAAKLITTIDQMMQTLLGIKS